jgi:hypothetical protein
MEPAGFYFWLYQTYTGYNDLMIYRILRFFDLFAVILVVLFAVRGDVPKLSSDTDRTRTFTRQIEFDYPTWVWDAAWLKIEQASIGAPYSFTRETSKEVVFDYMRTTINVMNSEYRIEQIYADPSVTDKEAATEFLRQQLDEFKTRQTAIAPFAESILQSQLTEGLAEFGLTTAGQPIPHVLYHTTPTPRALIVSPRNKIVQIANISILPTLTINDEIKLEDDVANSLDVSTLVVGIGGVGVYPTMVMETTDLRWMLDTIAHEWTHNYLNLRPLGLNYSTTPELRTMNETTASIAGNEVGTYVLEKYYPELLGSSPSSSLRMSRGLASFDPFPLPDDPPAFDFRAEMHETRVTADALLVEGKIEEAEAYMEERRQFLWQNGYLLRKLNQAYFAFHGAYADVPGGAAGEDPVGPAVRALREQSASLADFINTIAWMTSFDQLKQAIQQ